MSLATRCPSCDTVFRVVQDQLRVSEGWVRCGRCNGVFNAAEVLFDIDSGAPARLVLNESGDAQTPLDAAAPHGAEAASPVAAMAPAAAPSPPPHSPPPSPPNAWSSASDERSGALTQRLEPHFDNDPSWQQAAATERSLAAPAAQREEALLRMPSRLADEEIEVSIIDHVSTAADPSAARLAATPAFAPIQATPSFLRSAERSALWRRPAVRAALGAGVLVLALALVVQLALVWRDTLAAHLPATEPALRALCSVAGCSVQPLRRIDALAVDSSGLNRLEGSALYQLQVVLHNRAETAVMMPALDLSLTDAQGKLVSRRVLRGVELGLPQPALQAGQELPIKVLIATGERRVDGYTLELFYP